MNEQESLSQTVMTIGKEHKWKTFDAIPLGYFDWALNNMSIPEPLRTKMVNYRKDVVERLFPKKQARVIIE